MRGEDHDLGAGAGLLDRFPAAPGAGSDPDLLGVDAQGHLFGDDLLCDTCTTPWSVHQRDPAPCPYPASDARRKELTRKQFRIEMQDLLSGLDLRRFLRDFYRGY